MSERVGQYTETEILQLRQQLRRGQELAREASKRLGAPSLHPRIAAIKAATQHRRADTEGE